MTGREGPWELGALNVLDRTPLSSFNELGAKGFSDEDVTGRWAENTILRVRRDVMKTGTVGVIFADKRLTATPSKVWGGAANTLAGADLELPLGGRWMAAASNQHALTGPSHDQDWGMETVARVRRGAASDRGLGDGTSIDVLATHRTRDFRREMGFLPQAGMVEVEAAMQHAFEYDGALNAWGPGAQFTVTEEINGDFRREVAATSSWVLSAHELGAELGASQEEEFGQQVGGWWASGKYGADLNQFVSLMTKLEAGRQLDYAALAPAGFQMADLEITLRPLPGLRLDLSGLGARQKSLDATPELGSRLRGKATWQLTRPLGLRTIVEHANTTSLDPRLNSSLLVTWLLHPGTAVWAGYLETTDLGGPPVALERTVFLKASVLIRP